MVDAQVPLIDHLGIDQLFCVIGGSMGGMQVLEWAARHKRPRVHRRADRHRGLALLAEHRLPRGRPAGGDGRSRTGRRAATSSSATSRATASPWRAWPRTSPTCRRRRCSASSAAPCRTSPPRASPSTPTSRSRATCATRAPPSSTASTPTAISTSRGRSTTSTSPPSTATCSPTPSRAPRRASAWCRSPATGSIPRARAARSCRR